jgi:hypothetical protein
MVQAMLSGGGMFMDPWDKYSELPEVNWDDPAVQNMMREVEQLSLDRRRGKAPKKLLLSKVHGHTGPLLQALEAADDGDGNLILVCTVRLDIGEAFVVQTLSTPTFPASSRICTVRQCREGQRADEQGRSVYVSFLGYEKKSNIV